jgi:hypothetical protein
MLFIIMLLFVLPAYSGEFTTSAADVVFCIAVVSLLLLSGFCSVLLLGNDSDVARSERAAGAAGVLLFDRPAARFAARSSASEVGSISGDFRKEGDPVGLCGILGGIAL